VSPAPQPEHAAFLAAMPITQTLDEAIQQGLAALAACECRSEGSIDAFVTLAQVHGQWRRALGLDPAGSDELQLPGELGAAQEFAGRLRWWRRVAAWVTTRVGGWGR
jgi:hypothetical protein